MANSIQTIRNVYDIAKCAKDNGKPMDDEEIKILIGRNFSYIT